MQIFFYHSLHKTFQKKYHIDFWRSFSSLRKQIYCGSYLFNKISQTQQNLIDSFTQLVWALQTCSTFKVNIHFYNMIKLTYILLCTLLKFV